METLNNFELRLKEMAFSVMNLTDVTIEEKVKILESLLGVKIVIQIIKKGEEVKNEMD